MRSGALGTLTLAVLVLVATATVASAQVPIRIRGTIAKVSGQTLTIASRDNSTVEVRLADNAGVTAVVPAARPSPTSRRVPSWERPRCPSRTGPSAPRRC
jgi:hypothetical protein